MIKYLYEQFSVKSGQKFLHFLQEERSAILLEDLTLSLHHGFN